MQLNVLEAERARDALIKAIYSNLHQWIVEQINKKIMPETSIDATRHYIGILDMPGYGENFLLSTQFSELKTFTNERKSKFCYLQNVSPSINSSN